METPSIHRFRAILLLIELFKSTLVFANLVLAQTIYTIRDHAIGLDGFHHITHTVSMIISCLLLGCSILRLVLCRSSSVIARLRLLAYLSFTVDILCGMATLCFCIVIQSSSSAPLIYRLVVYPICFLLFPTELTVLKSLP